MKFKEMTDPKILGQNPFNAIIYIAVLFILLVGGANMLFSYAQDQATETGARALPVETGIVKYQDGHEIHHGFTGHIVAGRRANLSFEVGGTIAKINKDNGEFFKKGEVIALLDKGRLEARLNSLNAQIQEAEARVWMANKDLERTKKIYKDKNVSEQTLDKANTMAKSYEAQLARLKAEADYARLDLNSAALIAPFDGVIDRRLLDEGVVVAAGQTVVEILEQNNYEAQVGVPNEFVRLLKTGQTIELEGEQGYKFTAIVARISPAIRGDTRTQLVSLTFAPQDHIGFGELVTLKIDSYRAARGFWVPITALTADVRGLWRIYRVKEGDTPSEHSKIVVENVQILHTENERVFVIGTVDDGAQFVRTGISKLTPNQYVEPIINSPKATPNATPKATPKAMVN